MAERSYCIRNAGGERAGPFTASRVCALIAEGSVALDAFVAESPTERYLPITQFETFEKAFEARFGITRRPGTPAGTAPSYAQVRATGDIDTLLTGARDTSELTPLSNPNTVLTEARDTSELTPLSNPNTLPGGLLPEAAQEDPTGVVRTNPDLPRVEAAAEAPLLSDPTLPILSESGDLSTPPTHSAVVAILAVPTAPSLEAPLAPSLDPARDRDEALRARARAERARQLLIITLGSYTILLVVLYLLAVVMDLGRGELRSEASPLFVGRVGLLAGTGILLSVMLLGGEPFSRGRLALAPKSVPIALSVGALAGLLDPTRVAPASLSTAMALAVLTAIAEEAFFRIYLDRALALVVPHEISRVALSALLFGAFRATYSALLFERSSALGAAHALLMAVAGGVPYSLLFARTGSYAPPALAHVTAAVVALSPYF